jgi:hypothetical protein
MKRSLNREERILVRDALVFGMSCSNALRQSGVAELPDVLLRHLLDALDEAEDFKAEQEEMRAKLVQHHKEVGLHSPTRRFLQDLLGLPREKYAGMPEHEQRGFEPK